MPVRLLEAKDLEPLHELYTDLVSRIPYQWGVGFPQFREQLCQVTSPESPGLWAAESEVAFVGERAGKIVALATGAVSAGKGLYIQPNRGVVKFVLAGPNEDEAGQGVIAAVRQHLERFAPQEMRAMHYWYGPPFYNTGCGRLTGAWPWVGHWLTRSGFEVLRTYGTEVRMRRRVRERPGALRMPPGVEVVRVPGNAQGAGRLGPEYERCTELYVHGVKAGECRCVYGENFIRTTGTRLMYTEYLEVKPEYQGKGLGRVLLRQALIEAYAAGATEATLTADATNFSAMNLYRSEDYQPVDLLFEFQLRAEDDAGVQASAW